MRKKSQAVQRDLGVDAEKWAQHVYFLMYPKVEEAKKTCPHCVDIIAQQFKAYAVKIADEAIRTCIDMAERYDADIEGCDADELIRYGEGIECSFRLAYIIKYGKFPSKGYAWSVEFVDMLKEIRKQVHQPKG